LLEAFLGSEKKGYFAYEAFKKFEDPHKMEWYCCPKKCMRVTPVKAHERTVDGRKTWVVAHFRRIEREEGVSCYYGESDIHKAWKVLVAALFEDGVVKLSVGGLTFEPRSLKIKKVRQEYRWELGETPESFRRSDVGIEFASFNPLLGKGIAFEIQASKIDEREVEEREKFWTAAGYSVAWIPIEIFNLREYSVESDKPIEISTPWIIGRIKYLEEQLVQRLEQRISKMNEGIERVEALVRKLAVMEIPPDATCANCKYSGKDKNNKLVCWREWREEFIEALMDSGKIRKVIEDLKISGHYHLIDPPFPVSHSQVCRFWKRGW